MIPFYKYQGTGNDFIIIDDRDSEITFSNDKITHITSRKFGVGSDGIILIRNHNDYDFEMIFYNPDGSQSFCGNGSRCAILFAYHMGIVGREIEFISTDGPHEAKIITDSIVELKMSNSLKVLNLKSGAFFVDTGSPHYVNYLDNIEEIDLIKQARVIRNSAEYIKEGVNVNFIEKINNNIKMRTYERGVENETLSCGTGVTAAALVHASNLSINKGKVDVFTRGGQLSVSFAFDGKYYQDVWLKGNATYVFKGEIDG
jgi:diaminopimelate epimerase